ncbi:MAG: HlyD family efflux transporter periplasmic adaptor subunit [Bacteroidota bacterium]
MNRLKYFLMAVAFLGLLLNGCSSPEKNEHQQPQKKIRNVSVMAITPETITQKILINGVVRPLKTLDVVSQVQGIALNTQPSFKEGIRFKKGQLLVKIDDAEFRSNLIAQKSQYLSSIIRIMSDLKIDYPADFPTWESYLDKIDIERPLPKLPSASSKKLGYFLSARNIVNAYHSIVSQEKQLGKYRIYAPFDGVVTKDNFNRGSLIRPGVSLGSFNYNASYEVVAMISIKDASSLEKIKNVTFRSEDTGQEWLCTLDRLSEKVDTNTQSVKVFFTITGQGLKEGMYLEAEIELEAYTDAVRIPSKLVSRSNQVFILKDSLIQLKGVEPLSYSNSSVIVSGLQNGDLLINEKIKTTLQGTQAISK